MKYIATKHSILFILLLILNSTYAQIGIGTDEPEAMLDISSNTQGILIPRMSATQIEAIENPVLGELAYSLSNDGNLINQSGFWYFNGETWRPFVTESETGLNIYNSDGNLSANRTVTIDNRNLFFGNQMVLNSASQHLGIGETEPEHELAVNGNVRVRNLSAGNVVALDNGTLAIAPKVPYGSVKESLRSDDHNGWYKLDGRELSALPEIARTNALSVGISNLFPNANNLLMKQGTPLSTDGSATLLLTRDNLPEYTMTATTTESGAHTHNVSSPNSPNVLEIASGGTLVVRSGRGTNIGNASFAVGNSGNHVHASTIPSGGLGTPINILPESIAYTYFIYLGQ